MEVEFRSPEAIKREATVYIEQQVLELKGSAYYLDVETALKIISFISMLKHTGGMLAGIGFQILPFQIKFLIDVICTKRITNDRRRYTTALLFLPRKNGKTELIAALLNCFLFMDSEKGKEIYCAANETQQAQIIYKAATTMIKQNNVLSSRVNLWRSTKTIERTGEFEDFIKVLTANADTKDGLKPYVVVYDELHAAKDASLYTVLEEGMASRTEPLFIIISTAGYNQNGIMHRKYEYAKQVRDGIIQDDTFYSMIFEPDEDDDWTDEKTWIKCNPALGYGVQMDYLRSKFIKAKYSGEEEVAFKTKHLNIWTNSATVWIKDEVWLSNKSEIASLKGRKCYGGLDLSSTTDITALGLVFENEDGSLDLHVKMWIPEDQMRERSRRDRVPYADWVRDGWISTTPGNSVDYDFIERDILALVNDGIDIQEIAYDRWNASGIVAHLQYEGLNIGQGFASMSAPTKLFETLSLQEKINHGGNPALRWMLSNVVITKDAAENIKIDKSKSRERVDGIVASVMALGSYTANQSKDEQSPYEKMQLRFF